MHEDGEISVEAAGHVLLIGLNRPEKLNGLTPKMFGELVAAYERLEREDDLRVALLHAHGDHFTAGLDLPKFAESWAEGRDFAAEKDALDPFDRFGKRRTKPIVTAVKGITFTAGIELMLAGDVVIAADNCRFAQLETRRGIMATGGATYRFVARGGWGNAMRWLLTGAEFDAEEALRIGLVQEVVAAGEELDRAREVAEEIAAAAPLAVQATLANARLYTLEGEKAAVKLFDETQAQLAKSEDFAEGVASFKERRSAVFKGH